MSDPARLWTGRARTAAVCATATLAILLLRAPSLAAQSSGAAAAAKQAPAARSDSAFREVQARGAQIMGVDQYTSAHRFEMLEDGGRIVLERQVDDSAGVATIRAHMREVATRFSRGDFSLSAQVHAMEVPGTRVLAARHALVRYTVEDLPRGAAVRITTKDADALAALKEFLAFQNADHRTGHTAHQ